MVEMGVSHMIGRSFLCICGCGSAHGVLNRMLGVCTAVARYGTVRLAHITCAHAVQVLDLLSYQPSGSGFLMDVCMHHDCETAGSATQSAMCGVWAHEAWKIAKRRRLLATLEARVCVGYAYFATMGMLHMCQTMLCRHKYFCICICISTQRACTATIALFAVDSLKGANTTDTARARGPAVSV